MKITADVSDTAIVVHFFGELDHHAAKQAMKFIEDKIDVNLPRRCVLDMKNLSFMDSSGIAVILKTRKRMEEIGGSAAVENIAPQPEKVLTAAGLEHIIKITALKE